MAMMQHLSHGTWILLLFLYCTKGICADINDTAVPDEIRLHRKLLKYTEIVKPWAFNETIYVEVFLLPTYLQKLDTAQQIFSFVGILYFHWYHESYVWDPSDYGGVTMIQVPSAKTWKPKFEILNSAVSQVLAESTLNKYDVTIFSYGWAEFFVSEGYTTTCQIDPTYFPFDTQQCELLVFGDGTGNRTFNATGLYTGEFLESTEWVLQGTSVSNVFQPFKQMVFTFKFKRNSGFYVITMIMPLLILSILGLLMFPLPADSGEKISLGMACLLSFVVIQASLPPYLPTSYTTMPYIVMLIFALMVFNALAISATIIMISVLSMEPKPRMPGWLDKLVSRSAKVHHNSRSTEMTIEDSDATHGAQTLPPNIEKCTRCSGDEEKEQLEQKWKKLGNLTNNFLFTLFAATLITLICAVFGIWVSAANSAG